MQVIKFLSVKPKGNAGEDHAESAGPIPLAFLPESKTEI